MTRRALVIGIDDYSIAPLVGCVNDARAMAEVLGRNHDGSPNFDVRLLTAPPRTINRSDLKRAVERLFESPADVALLYFSGHGTENNLGGFVVTQDAKSYDEGVSLNDVLTFSNKSLAREVVVILDSCHSGALGEIPALSNTNTQLREGVSILTASRSSEAAIETGGMGLFTSLVVAALEGGAADNLGYVKLPSVYSYVDESLGPWDQRPLLKAHVATLVPLRLARPRVDVTILRRLPEWFATPDAKFPLDSSYEPDAEPHHEDKEEVFGLLQKCRAAHLVEPIGEIHMYYAAMNNKACALTPLGRHYWRLANEGRI